MPTEVEFFKEMFGYFLVFFKKKNVRAFIVHYFHGIHVDLIFIFEDVWVVAATQTAKYGRFNKTSLLWYNPG